MKRLVQLTALLAALGVAGCGGSDNSSGSSTTAAATPSELLGTYTMTLKPGDVPASKPPEITDASPKWTLKITKSGGVDNGPALSLVSNQGTLESSPFTVDGSSVQLNHEECDAGGGPTLVQSVYGYSVDGRTLKFTTVKNGCSDGVAEALLTSEPWQKQG
jgi:hypothetical protein